MKIKCPGCNGSGRVNCEACGIGKVTCPACRGSDYLEIEILVNSDVTAKEPDEAEVVDVAALRKREMKLLLDWAPPKLRKQSEGSAAR